ncbi:PIF1 like helicase AAA domain [Trypanosoma vivax]|uniref:ATP-dependent DNA helicase n=1 Tax=Trypanosoma vivax (strain Y486) TaxID=1055687 RepID=G0U012_TRYVY|nr:PIF1 like helicase AAA domain [Trypanosoma vivax]CCC49409.1 putative DNA repair and recombination protein,mitochondrial precursor [Trypanosoma vivax Y486]
MWKGALQAHNHLRTVKRFGELEKSGGADASNGESVSASPPQVNLQNTRHIEDADSANTEPIDSYCDSMNAQVKRRRIESVGNGQEALKEEVEEQDAAASSSAHEHMLPAETAVSQVTAPSDEIASPLVGIDETVGSSTSNEDGHNVAVNESPSNDATEIHQMVGTAAPLLDSPSGVSPLTGEQAAPQSKWKLSDQQQSVLDIVTKHRRNVFLTGGAGTGKSHLLRAIIDALPARTTFVTATTGLAALNLGGTTLHSFCGCGLVDQSTHSARSVYELVSSRSKAKKNWRKCNVLIIDEVSMLDAWFLDVLEYVARNIRGSRAPFGGIQLVLSGDFLQLPPVCKSGKGQEAHLCFEAGSWCRVNPLVCVLSNQFRQKDVELFMLLNEMRFGNLTVSSLALLSSLSAVTTVGFLKERPDARPTTQANTNGTEASGSDGEDIVDSRGRSRRERQEGFTVLRARRSEVDAINTERFNDLKTEIFTYNGFHKGEGRFPADLPSCVSVRVGCRVMLLTNLDLTLGLANGSIGTVERFINVGNRYNSANPNARSDLQCLAGHNMLPVVRFEGRGNNANAGDPTCASPLIVVEPHRWTTYQGDREVSCSIQIPLQLAYAITIHKSQGMSLSHVNVDFRGMFEEGQAYVALSRCTNIANLIIENFDAKRVNANTKALAYYKALEQVKEQQFKEEEKILRGHTQTNPWGPYDADDLCVEEDYITDDVKSEGGIDGCELNNLAVLVERYRRQLMPQYIMHAALRRRVLSVAEAATSVRGSLLVMDTSSLLALTSLPNSGDVYDEIFNRKQNMMRVPHVVKAELLRIASEGTMTDMRSTPTIQLSFSSACLSSLGNNDACFEAMEVASIALDMMGKAKKDFVSDEQRVGETHQLPSTLPEWRAMSPLLLLAEDEEKTTAGPEQEIEENTEQVMDMRNQHIAVLQFTCYLNKLHGTNTPVLVCTESVELAARALSVGLRVCSMSYLCPCADARD